MIQLQLHYRQSLCNRNASFDIFNSKDQILCETFGKEAIKLPKQKESFFQLLEFDAN